MVLKFFQNSDTEMINKQEWEKRIIEVDKQIEQLFNELRGYEKELEGKTLEYRNFLFASDDENSKKLLVEKEELERKIQITQDKIKLFQDSAQEAKEVETLKYLRFMYDKLPKVYSSGVAKAKQAIKLCDDIIKSLDEQKNLSTERDNYLKEIRSLYYTGDWIGDYRPPHYIAYDEEGLPLPGSTIYKENDLKNWKPNKNFDTNKFAVPLNTDEKIAMLEEMQEATTNEISTARLVYDELISKIGSLEFYLKNY